MIKCENGWCRRLARRRRWLVLRGQIDAEEAVVAAASTHLRWRGIWCAPMCCARERFGTGESVEGANLTAHACPRCATAAPSASRARHHACNPLASMPAACCVLSLATT